MYTNFHIFFFQISDSDANRSLTKHRKIASSFRDTQLFDIFQLSCTLLRTAYENRSKLNFNDESQVQIDIFGVFCHFAILATFWTFSTIFRKFWEGRATRFSMNGLKWPCTLLRTAYENRS